jgi:hypothetical protein
MLSPAPVMPVSLPLGTSISLLASTLAQASPLPSDPARVSQFVLHKCSPDAAIFEKMQPKMRPYKDVGSHPSCHMALR